MAKEVVWTEPAKEDLYAIYDFNCKRMSEQKAFEITERLVSIGKLLEKEFVTGVRHISAISPDTPYMKLIHSHYLIIFRKAGSVIYVNRIFDSRQNPEKLNI